MGEPGMSRTRERRVRKLIERGRAGRPVSLAEHMAVCPYRTLLMPPGVVATAGTKPDGVAAVLGFAPADFTAAVRDGIVADLRAGKCMLLVSNDAVLRDFAKAESYRAIYHPDEPSLLREPLDEAQPALDPSRGAEAWATREAMGVLNRLVDAAAFRAPHLPIDSLLHLG
jgi:hypothetical protein